MILLQLGAFGAAFSVHREPLSYVELDFRGNFRHQ